MSARRWSPAPPSRRKSSSRRAGPKVYAFKKRRRKNSKRKRGHKQDLTVVRIVDIVGADGKRSKAAAPAQEAAAVAEEASPPEPRAARCRHSRAEPRVWRRPFGVGIMAHKKAGGSSRNGRDSDGRRLGVKKFGGEQVIPGNIIVRQRGTKFHAGRNVGMGTDHTLFATAAGAVQFEKKGDRQYVSIVALEAAE